MYTSRDTLPSASPASLPLNLCSSVPRRLAFPVTVLLDGLTKGRTLWTELKWTCWLVGFFVRRRTKVVCQSIFVYLSFYQAILLFIYFTVFSSVVAIAAWRRNGFTLLYCIKKNTKSEGSFVFHFAFQTIRKKKVKSSMFSSDVIHSASAS